MKTHSITVVIRTDDSQSESTARDRLHSWIETHGHSASSHGFEFIETRRAVYVSRSTRTRKKTP